MRFEEGCRKSIFDEVLRDSRRERNPELIASLVAIYRTHEPRISIAADALHALKILSGSPVSVAVISDGPAVCQSRKVAALGLASFADPILLTEVLGPAYHKPYPKAFQQIQQSSPRDRYIYIADNPHKDFIAPNQLGWTTIRVRRSRGLHYDAESTAGGVDFEIADCASLVELISKL